ncbi:glycoside hydrolase family 25 protein [Streptococcus dentapri]|uniref:Glycoside hydrolase family 25 protein n=1 Tax=Streptococcus dentapri TaxID=573564 RepID=A0ABV8CYQ8_9STRE
MRKRIKPIVVYVFLGLIGIFLSIAAVTANNLQNSTLESAKKTIPSATSTPRSKTSAPSSSDDDNLNLDPIVDLSGWQLPKQIDYDTLSQNISGAIVRVYGGSQISKDSNAAHSTGIDKSFKTHIEELQKRDVPVAVYSYALGGSVKEMKQEAQTFYKNASPYKPTYYWIDVEEETMKNMDKGVEAFRAELKRLGAQKVGIYIGTYFMTEQEISVKKFDSVWLPTYGSDTGYYEAQPETDVDYDLHQYTSQGWLPGFDGAVDLNQINPNKDTRQVFEKLFGDIKE